MCYQDHCAGEYNKYLYMQEQVQCVWLTLAVMAVSFEKCVISTAVYGIMAGARTYHHHHYHYLWSSRTLLSREANHCSPQGCKLSTRCSAAGHDREKILLFLADKTQLGRSFFYSPHCRNLLFIKPLLYFSQYFFVSWNSTDKKMTPDFSIHLKQADLAGAVWIILVLVLAELGFFSFLYIVRI